MANFNGWTNHQTWVAAATFDNDETLYSQMRRLTQDARVREIDAETFGSELRNRFPYIVGVWCSSAVNWHEIAVAWLAEGAELWQPN